VVGGDSLSADGDSALRRCAVLISGMSGTGKSSVLAELGRRGHRVVDTDEPGWILDPQAAEPLWDLVRIGGLLEHHREGWLFVAGCVANQGAVYDRVDAVVLLSAPLETILERVAHRANPFGSTPQDQGKIASDLAAFEPLLRAGCDHELVTTTSIIDVAAALERLAATAHRIRS
jgi:AAA domain